MAEKLSMDNKQKITRSTGNQQAIWKLADRQGTETIIDKTVMPDDYQQALLNVAEGQGITTTIYKCMLPINVLIQGKSSGKKKIVQINNFEIIKPNNTMNSGNNQQARLNMVGSQGIKRTMDTDRHPHVLIQGNSSEQKLIYQNKNDKAHDEIIQLKNNVKNFKMVFNNTGPTSGDNQKAIWKLANRQGTKNTIDKTVMPDDYQQALLNVAEGQGITTTIYKYMLPINVLIQGKSSGKKLILQSNIDRATAHDDITQIKNDIKNIKMFLDNIGPTSGDNQQAILNGAGSERNNSATDTGLQTYNYILPPETSNGEQIKVKNFSDLMTEPNELLKISNNTIENVEMMAFGGKIDSTENLDAESLISLICNLPGGFLEFDENYNPD
uniref:Uncharacterized protein n=1 Tax=Sipha flava TaxID=143950 RepID=A0A2S2QVM5_9HEMI